MREEGLGPCSEEQRRLHSALGFLTTPDPPLTRSDGLPPSAMGLQGPLGLLLRDTPHSPMVAPYALWKHHSDWGLTKELGETGRLRRLPAPSGVSPGVSEPRQAGGTR